MVKIVPERRQKTKMVKMVKMVKVFLKLFFLYIYSILLYFTLTILTKKKNIYKKYRKMNALSLVKIG